MNKGHCEFEIAWIVTQSFVSLCGPLKSLLINFASIELVLLFCWVSEFNESRHCCELIVLESWCWVDKPHSCKEFFFKHCFSNFVRKINRYIYCPIFLTFLSLLIYLFYFFTAGNAYSSSRQSGYSVPPVLSCKFVLSALLWVLCIPKCMKV